MYEFSNGCYENLSCLWVRSYGYYSDDVFAWAVMPENSVGSWCSVLCI